MSWMKFKQKGNSSISFFLIFSQIYTQSYKSNCVMAYTRKITFIGTLLNKTLFDNFFF